MTTFHCPACASDKAHELRKTSTGAAWVCSEGHTTKSYTQQDMYDYIAARAKGLADQLATKPVPATNGLRVYVLDAEGRETELDPQFVRAHAEAGREVPKEGEPMARAIPQLPAPFNVVRYGKVSRVIEDNIRK